MGRLDSSRQGNYLILQLIAMPCQLALAGLGLSTHFPTAQKLHFISTNLQEYKAKWTHPKTKEATLREE
jgi:hypothetical protein